ncbi:MAG TPA: hypothetical protein VES21_02550 [Nocardioidaceae bacterium]|nr:hypothetical protein [Nocardioidaceae bacterium]
MTAAPTVTLECTADAGALIDLIAEAQGGRTGLRGLLGDLDATAHSLPVPARAAGYGFAWNDDDVADSTWWPQGITSSADASSDGLVMGRRIVVVSWYARKATGGSRGSRLTFVDLTDESAPRYRHVELVEAVPGEGDATDVGFAPVRIHAGGIAWYGGTVVVADTHGGLRLFSTDDILQLGAAAGSRYVIAQGSAYRPPESADLARLRFSYLSLDRTSQPHRLIAGEYGVGAQTTRLVAFSLPTDGSWPDGLTGVIDTTSAPSHTQGAVAVSGAWYLAISRGRFRRGTMEVRTQGSDSRRHVSSLVIGCEDLSYDPVRDLLWGLSEYPGRRFVYAIPLRYFAGSRLRGLLHPPDLAVATHLRAVVSGRKRR